MLLRAAVGTAAPQATTPALGAAELVGAALEAFAVDPELLAAERARVRVLLIDDAQQLDPQAARLVRVLAAGAELALIAGDPNQAVFGFRGGEAPAALLVTRPMAPSVTLTVSHRCAPAVARAVSGVARRLPGGSAGRQIDGTGDEDGSVTVRVAASAHAEAATDRRRAAARAPGRRGAVVADGGHRPVGATGRRRGCRARWPPPVSRWPHPRSTGPLSDEPAARALLTVLAATADGLNGEQALALLTGPIGRVDPVSLRQLRRTLQRANPGRLPGDFGDLLVDALHGRRAVSRTAVAARCGGCVRCWTRPRAAHRDGQDPRYTLWAAWHRSGLQRRWLSASERGGPAGAQADQGPRRGDRVVRHHRSATCRARPGASLRGLVEHVAALQLPAPAPSRCRESSRSRCSARTPRSATNGTSWSSPACRKGCGPTRFRAAACWAPSGCSTCSTVSPRTPRCGRRCWPRSAGCWWRRWAGPAAGCW